MISFLKLLMALTLGVSISANAADDNANSKDPKKDLNTFLVDITGGAVSASNLIGVDKSAITQVQTSQDLVAAIQPFRNNDQKAGVGLAITPARTSIMPMSRRTYFGINNDNDDIKGKNNILTRMLGALTVSYAENSEDINSVSYRKAAASIDTSFYLDPERDPIYLGGLAFDYCVKQRIEENANGIKAIQGHLDWNDDAKQQALEELTKKLDEFLRPCTAKKLKEYAKWNDSRVSISYGEARIRPPGGSYQTLGKYLTVNAQIIAGPQSLVSLSARRIRDLLDTKTLGNATLGYSNKSLLAARFTYGDVEGTDMRGIVEVSNAKSGSNEGIKDTFIYAVGIDKSIAKGMWLQFKLGRNRTLDSGKEQTTGLFNLSIQPSLTSWKM